MTTAAVPWWQAPCEANVAALGGTLCPDVQCESTLVRTYANAFCTCQPPYLNGCAPTFYPGCCAFDESSPVAIVSMGCFCCCGGGVAAAVAVDATTSKPIEDCAPGDLVYVADDASLRSWTQKPVAWTAGVGGGGGASTMLRVTFGDPSAPDELIVSRGQPFLMPDRTLKAAAALVPGSDSLVAQDGSTRRLLAVEAGSSKHGLHHVATGDGPADTAEGHLLLLNGVVAGDWALHVDVTTNGDAGPPELGSEAYRQANPQLQHTELGARVADAEHAPADAAAFEPAGAAPQAALPAGAQRFLTQPQAHEIQSATRQYPPTWNTGTVLAQHLFRIFGGMYTGMTFRIADHDPLPNVYFYRDRGAGTVVVTGGLLRTPGAGYEALALAIAHAIGGLLKAMSDDRQGHGCVAEADYAAVTAVIPQTWAGLTGTGVIKAGTIQLTDLFALVKRHRGGSDPCADPSLDCRLESMRAAFDLQPLPACGGGPPPPRPSLEA